jgi:hypothetical protein
LFFSLQANRLQKGGVMRMQRRKWIVVLVVVGVLIASRAYDLAYWLDRMDLVRPARSFEETYLTGTTLAVLVIVLVLLRDDHAD